MAPAVARLAVPYTSQKVPIPGLDRRVALFACGPASAAMVAAYYAGGSPRLAQATRLVGGDALVGHGTQPWQLTAAIAALAPGRRAGNTSVVTAQEATDLLSWQLRLGHPVIALVRPSWVATALDHYVVVTGADAARRLLWIHDPLAGPGLALQVATFQEAWKRIRWLPPYSYVWAR